MRTPAPSRELAEAEVASLIAAWDREAHFPVDLAVMVEGGPRTRARGAAGQDAAVNGCPKSVLKSSTAQKAMPGILPLVYDRGSI